MMRIAAEPLAQHGVPRESVGQLAPLSLRTKLENLFPPANGPRQSQRSLKAPKPYMNLTEQLSDRSRTVTANKFLLPSAF